MVDLMRQLLHRACSEATTKAPQALEVVQTLAVALDSDAGCVRTAGDGKGRLCVEEISSLSHSVVFPYFFALIAKEGFLISSCYSLELWNLECQVQESRQIGSGQTRDGKSECRHSRNQ